MSSDKYDAFLIRFNGTNYSAWAFHFEIFVKGKDLWGHTMNTSLCLALNIAKLPYTELSKLAYS